MTKGADEETFSKLLSACYSKAIDDNYEAYMSASEVSPERAAIVERIDKAYAQEIAARRQELDAVLRKRKGERQARGPEGVSRLVAVHLTFASSEALLEGEPFPAPALPGFRSTMALSEFQPSCPPY